MIRTVTGRSRESLATHAEELAGIRKMLEETGAMSSLCRGVVKAGAGGAHDDKTSFLP